MDKDRLCDAGIDYTSAMKYFAGNEAMFEKYLIKFKDDKYMDLSREAFKSGDYNELLKNIHVMKGLVSTLGMNALFKACSDVVMSIRAKAYDDLGKKMAAVEHEYELVMKIFE